MQKIAYLLVAYALVTSPAFAAEKVCLKKNGSIVADSRCPKGSKPLSASSLASLGTKGADGTPGSQGPQGDQGAKGDQGVKGDKGDAGAAGISDLRIVDSNVYTVVAPNSCPIGPICVPLTTATATCPSGFSIIRSYCVIRNDPNQAIYSITATSSESSDFTAVTCPFSNIWGINISGHFYARAVCAPMPPM